jgi:hypothetical protein
MHTDIQAYVHIYIHTHQAFVFSNWIIFSSGDKKHSDQLILIRNVDEIWSDGQRLLVSFTGKYILYHAHVCMYVCMYVKAYVWYCYIQIRVYVCIVYVYVLVCVCMCMSIYIYTYIHTYTCIHMYTYKYEYVCVCILVHIYAC